MAKRQFTPNSTVTVDGTEIKTFKKELSSANVIEVEVGTTGHMGGDTGHGGRTYFRLSNVADTDMRMRYRDCGEEKTARDPGEVVLAFGGDCELDTFCEALRIGYEVLSRHAFWLEDTEEEPDDGMDAKIAVLEEIAAEYPYKTIENIIKQLKSIKKEAEK